MYTVIIRLVLLTGLVFSSLVNAGAQQAPKLILQITVDQLRGDLPMRYLDRLGEGGFRYLLDKGTHSLDFARTLIEKEQLGQHAVPDYLSISITFTGGSGYLENRPAVGAKLVNRCSVASSP